MIVVADTSPINYLVQSGYVWILPKLFGQVLVPHAVIAELKHPRAPAEVRAFVNAPPSWLQCMRVSCLDAGLPPSLGDGEREAISLAIETGADALLIDDFAGRKEAESRGIPSRGTLAVLLQAALRGQIDFEDALETVKKLGFRVSRAVEKVLLELYKAQER